MASPVSKKHGANHPESDRPTKRSKVENGADVKMAVESDSKSSSSGYGWEQVHADLEANKEIGVYGGGNAVFFGLAELRAGIELDKHHVNRSADEFYEPALKKHLELPSTRAHWNDLCTIDPLGMFANRPTMAATTAQMTIPELKLEPDGKIVNDDGTINCVKCAVDYVWNLPRLSERLGFKESDVRERLYKYTLIEKLKNPELRAFLPPTGAATVYFVGDIEKLSDPATEIAVRVHDSCMGSDVFGTDICTCRPYLVFAIKHIVDCAKRGGVGLIVYFQKEGRSLGEVTKFRVYNARKHQTGGDRAEKYFYQTESIAGIRDARFQEMMPDILLWLGITRIDWLLSMSSDKYDAITKAGIDVMQRVALPDMYVPKNATVEISAKISAGYHTDHIASEKIIAELRRLEKIRERCGQIYKLGLEGKLRHFSLHMEKMDETVQFVVKVIKQNYPDMKIPYHSRWRHFPDDRIVKLRANWHCDKIERARRLIDVATVSVLLDAGSGPTWKYCDASGQVFRRSEGIAVATLDMFEAGLFSSDTAQPHRVNSHALKNIQLAAVTQGFQTSNTNPFVGVENRFKILKRLGKALDSHAEFFGQEVPRPGNVVDYVLKHVVNGRVSLRVLWQAIVEGLESIWPHTISGIRRGDIWVYNPLMKVGEPGSDLVPFHKLSQWLTYSLLEPFQELGIDFDDMNLLTGLAEYRNGGLFVDMGVLQLAPQHQTPNKFFDVGSELVIEWRAMTICLLDVLAERVRKSLNMNETQLTLAQVLQGGTWAAGRICARERREDAGPPINIRSDGSVF